MGRIASTVILIALFLVLVGLYAYVVRRLDRIKANHQERRVSATPMHVLERSNDLYLGYDAAVDTIERLLDADKYRLMFTPEEQAELRAHVSRFDKIQNPN